MMSDTTLSRPEVVSGHTDVIYSTSVCHILQWSLSRQMTSNRARYLNQDLIVLVRCRKPVIFRVGICVGIGWCCLLLTILNHEVKSHVLHRPHYVGRVVSLCYLNVLTMWLR